MLFLDPAEDTWIGVLRLKLHIPGSRSLKERRRAVAQVRDRLRARSGLSVAEVGHLHDHDKAIMAVATLSRDSTEVRRALDRVAHDIESWGRAVVLSRDIRMFRPFDGHDDDSELEGTSSDGDGIPDAPWADD